MRRDGLHPQARHGPERRTLPGQTQHRAHLELKRAEMRPERIPSPNGTSADGHVLPTRNSVKAFLRGHLDADLEDPDVARMPFFEDEGWPSPS